LDKVIIRTIEEEEIPLLADFLYEAIFQPEGTSPLPYDIIGTPEINVYIDGFGKKDDDFCLVADLSGKIIGAVWIRILDGNVKGYGNIDSKTPEFAISLLSECRNRGYGTLLMKKMIEYLKLKGYAQASLSVDKKNHAARMYIALGFEVIRENEHDYLMILKLT